MIRTFSGLLKNRNARLIIFALILSAVQPISAQRLLKISVEGGNGKRLSFINRRGAEYVSAKELAGILNAGYYFSRKSGKAEIKFQNSRVKFSAFNQFLVLTDRAGYNPKVYQLPISTMLVKGDVYLPLVYAIQYISKAYGKVLEFDSGEKNLVVTNKILSTGNVISGHINSKYGTDFAAEGSEKYDISGIDISERANGTLVRLKMDAQKFKPPTSIFNNILYVFLSGISIDPNIVSGFKSAGLIRSISIKDVEGNQQLEFKLKQGYDDHEAFVDEESGEFIITIHNKKFAIEQKPVGAEREKWNFDVIVIDAGHGGKDPGAIGVGGVKEKDVNLGIALKLGRLISQKMPGVKVVYTRKTDKFIDLYKRGKIANENNGKLFISLHCNSLPRRDERTRGFEVYLLRPGRTDEAIKIAEKENSVIEYEDNPKRYKELTEENFILVSMAHSSYMRYSEHFSDLLNQNWKKNVKIPSRGIKQAGFLVLVGASMPSVLIENGFLTNTRDTRYLNSARGQNDIAKSIYQSIVSFKRYYDKILADSGS